MNIKNRHKIISLGLAVIIGMSLWAFIGNSKVYGQVSSVDELRKMAILENGRKKPLDTYAQNMLKQFSGQSKVEKQSAIEWLARVLFDPDNSYEDKIFLVTNSDVLDSIDVERQGKERDRYSFSQLRPGISKLHELAVKASKINDKDRSFVDNEIMALYNKIYIYQELVASFEFLIPSPDFSIESEETLKTLDFPLKRKHFSYFDLAQKKTEIVAAMEAVKEKKPEERTPSEKEISELFQRLDRWAKFDTENPLTIIPSIAKTHEPEEKWLTPWDMAKNMVLGKSAGVPKIMFLAQDMVYAYRNGNQESFDKSVEEFNDAIIERAGTQIRPKAISLEVFYNKVDPFYKAEFFYGFSVLFMLLSFIVMRKWFYRLSFLLLSLGFTLHILGQIARIIIMQRPPVTNLYETFVFTGLITVLLGITLELFRKRNIGILTGGLAGVVMLLIAGKYAMEGDTMGMLVAVLDSNFWLASHVTTIILGYAGVLLSGFIGHVYMIQRIFTPKKEELLENTFQAIYAIQAFGLVFTFIGTTLGGIWADQSWGRFWGWDPKENGALLILLWSAILFHAKLAKWIKEIGFALGAVIGVITVALAWFGVNLLGVGLHSYGFTSGVATLLLVFVIIELVFICVTLLIVKYRK